jgi:NAD(P)-dependent dehydrogenase (short-subunit alcohol dehydrogenase family)
MDLGLTGKKAIITGGSRGIGRAIAERLLQEGAAVAISARGQEGVDSAVAEMSSLGDVRGAAVDVADGDALAAWVAESADAMGGLDIIVSNASGGGAGRTTAEAFQQTLAVDVLGLVRMVEAGEEMLTASDSGAIVAISTTAAIEHFMGGVDAYSTIKAGLIKLVAGYAQALGPKGIRANTISPGPIFVEGGGWDHIKNNMEDFYNATIANEPLGRLGTAPEVANVAAFLASPAASWVTGTNIVVDGGYTKAAGF